ncbi:iron chaperone [Flavimaricola marinus]|uniref:YdhG-like domain-containing protein n=1 Tax=Flavimaricola marinus TaxID=1819565 RepID=A0A238LDR9_9RHOB|nr:DUF1801 domain-containing protein [Flavimaricola marinus]SMY07829.1 hypothetical protein LOM8899_01969 [Flavimaricola marinus]
MTTITPDSYLAALPSDQQRALGALRQQLRALLPDAVEVMSYAMPGFRLGKKMVAGYAGFAKHCGLYPHSGGIIPQITDEIDALGFKWSKSGVLFTPAHPLPETLVDRIVALRLAEIGA